MKYGIKHNISIPGEIYTKAELFKVIRELTNAGYFLKSGTGITATAVPFIWSMFYPTNPNKRWKHI